MNHKTKIIGYRSSLCILALATAACAPPDAETTVPPAQAPATDAGKPVQNLPSSSEVAPVQDPGTQISAAIQDLSTRLAIPEDEISASEARAVNWRSGALGCPEKGRNYTQAIVPGVLLLLQAEGKSYRYHAGTTGKPFYCPDARAEAPAYGTGDALM